MTETKYETKKIAELKDFNNQDKTETFDRQIFNRLRQIKLRERHTDGAGWEMSTDYGNLALLYKTRVLKDPDTGDAPDPKGIPKYNGTEWPAAYIAEREEELVAIYIENMGPDLAKRMQEKFDDGTPDGTGLARLVREKACIGDKTARARKANVDYNDHINGYMPEALDVEGMDKWLDRMEHLNSKRLQRDDPFMLVEHAIAAFPDSIQKEIENASAGHGDLDDLDKMRVEWRAVIERKQERELKRSKHKAMAAKAAAARDGGAAPRDDVIHKLQEQITAMQTQQAQMAKLMEAQQALAAAGIGGGGGGGFRGGGGGGRPPAELRTCNHCKRRVTHKDDDCWIRFPEKVPSAMSFMFPSIHAQRKALGLPDVSAQYKHVESAKAALECAVCDDDLKGMPGRVEDDSDDDDDADVRPFPKVCAAKVGGPQAFTGFDVDSGASVTVTLVLHFAG